MIRTMVSPLSLSLLLLVAVLIIVTNVTVVTGSIHNIQDIIIPDIYTIKYVQEYIYAKGYIDLSNLTFTLLDDDDTNDDSSTIATQSHTSTTQITTDVNRIIFDNLYDESMTNDKNNIQQLSQIIQSSSDMENFFNFMSVPSSTTSTSIIGGTTTGSTTESDSTTEDNEDSIHDVQDEDDENENESGDSNEPEDTVNENGNSGDSITSADTAAVDSATGTTTGSTSSTSGTGQRRLQAEVVPKQQNSTTILSSWNSRNNNSSVVIASTNTTNGAVTDASAPKPLLSTTTTKSIDVLIVRLSRSCYDTTVSNNRKKCNWPNLGIGQYISSPASVEPKLLLCCTKEAISLGYCSNYGHVIINSGNYNTATIQNTTSIRRRRRHRKNRFHGHVISVEFPISNGTVTSTKIQPELARIPITRSQKYAVVFANCNMEDEEETDQQQLTNASSTNGDTSTNINNNRKKKKNNNSNIAIDGNVIYHSNHGYLPGQLFKYKDFNTFIFVLHLIVIIWYIYRILLFHYYKSVYSTTKISIDQPTLNVEYYIVIALFISTNEALVRTIYYSIWNTTGLPNLLYYWISTVLRLLKEGYVRCLTVILAMGWTMIISSSTNTDTNTDSTFAVLKLTGIRNNVKKSTTSIDDKTSHSHSTSSKRFVLILALLYVIIECFCAGRVFFKYYYKNELISELRQLYRTNTIHYFKNKNKYITKNADVNNYNSDFYNDYDNLDHTMTVLSSETLQSTTTIIAQTTNEIYWESGYTLRTIRCIINIIFFCVLLISISATKQYLRRTCAGSINELSKYYNKTTSTLYNISYQRIVYYSYLLIVFASIGIIIGSMTLYDTIVWQNNPLKQYFHYNHIWLKDAISQLNYCVIVIGIALLWYPQYSKNTSNVKKQSSSLAKSVGEKSSNNNSILSSLYQYSNRVIQNNNNNNSITKKTKITTDTTDSSCDDDDYDYQHDHDRTSQDNAILTAPTMNRHGDVSIHHRITQQQQKVRQQSQYCNNSKKRINTTVQYALQHDESVTAVTEDVTTTNHDDSISSNDSNGSDASNGRSDRHYVFNGINYKNEYNNDYHDTDEDDDDEECGQFVTGSKNTDGHCVKACQDKEYQYKSRMKQSRQQQLNDESKTINNQNKNATNHNNSNTRSPGFPRRINIPI